MRSGRRTATARSRAAAIACTPCSARSACSRAAATSSALRRDGGSVRRGGQCRRRRAARRLQDLRQPAARGQQGADDLDQQRDLGRRPGASAPVQLRSAHGPPVAPRPGRESSRARRRRRARARPRPGSMRWSAATSQAASVASAALRSAVLAGGGAADAEAVGRSLLLGLRGGRALPPAPAGGGLDLSLYESDPPIAPLLDRLAAPGAARDFSLLLTGPPGTGKTALAACLAERLDRPLTVKRASDLLSKWVGETEANIADGLRRRARGGVGAAVRRGRLAASRPGGFAPVVGDHPGQRIADLDGFATPCRSSPRPTGRTGSIRPRFGASSSRSSSGPCPGEAAERAWARFFAGATPAGLGDRRRPDSGDFAVVARQLRYRPDASPGGDPRLARSRGPGQAGAAGEDRLLIRSAPFSRRSARRPETGSGRSPEWP